MFCTNCGAKNDAGTRFCVNCGTAVEAATGAGASVGTAVASVPAGSFPERFRQYFSSNLIFVGLILLTIGTTLPLFVNFGFGGIIGFALAVLPIVGYWLIYFAAKQPPTTPDNTSTGITLIKISAVIGLVVFCILLGAVSILMIIVLIGGGMLVDFLGGGGGILFALFLVFAIYVALSILWIKFYYIAFFNVLRSIREGLNTGYVSELKGAGSYTILSFVMLGLALLGNLISIATVNAANNFVGNFRSELFSELPAEFHGIIDIAVPFGGFSAWPMVWAMLSSVGMILVVVAIRQLADSLRDNPLT
jgi:uncharacterized membrane protein